MITVEVNKVEQPKDIFFKGNLVISDWNIVLVKSGIDSMVFSGQVIETHGNGEYPMGTYSESWNKEVFTQFTGTITITSK